jgi:hypothetical protein
MIKIKDIVTDTFTNTAGYGLYLALVDRLDNTNDIINLSFDDVSSTSSSFLNSSIGALIEERGMGVLKRIKPIKVGATQSEVLKKYIASVSKLAKN